MYAARPRQQDRDFGQCPRRYQPINGLRHPPEAGTSGWFIWGGQEFSTASDFFKPLHIHHLQERCNAVLPYLALPPGWRFLIVPDYEDVWYDSSLLMLS
ncbi:immunity protein Imm33 domain-containing protein [Rhizobium changzhiense]|uniref:immunity protein Imm33 domain-containing protein n=1 Tax=Rhizobium changzhiense TaxID=2692317 RepID=UPI003CC812DB